MKIDTLNQHFVSAQGSHVLIQRPPRGPLTRLEALRMAAWLVAIAEPLGEAGEPTFDEVRKVIEGS